MSEFRVTREGASNEEINQSYFDQTELNNHSEWRNPVSGLQFNKEKTLHDLKHYLPAQAALRDFIHHNSLHAYQHLKFFKAIFKASTIFGYQVTLQLEEYRQLYADGRIKESILDKIIIAEKGDTRLTEWKEKLLNAAIDTTYTPRIHQLRNHWKTGAGIDMDTHVHPLLFRLLSSYLDQGISIWKFPIDDRGFIPSLRKLEKQSPFSFFKTKTARSLFLKGDVPVEFLLQRIVGDEQYYQQYLFDQQFSHQGWSGFVAAAERSPGTLLETRSISLIELIEFELLLEWDTLQFHFGENFSPLHRWIKIKPTDLFADVPSTLLSETLSLWQKAFEWSYYDEVLAAIQQSYKLQKNETATKSFQAIFCIDERECSIRRHIESIVPDCETFGAPGFFGVEFYFQPINGRFYEKLCPAPVTPAYLIKEYGIHHQHEQDILYSQHPQKIFPGIISSLSLGLLAGMRMFQNMAYPTMSPAISNAFGHMNKEASLTIENKHPEDRENNLQIGFTIDEMAIRVEAQLRGIGLVQQFAPLVYVVAHGSSSANNPHHGAHDCGACSGRPGSVNARVFAAMANHPQVRKKLSEKGIHIPAATCFVGALHDTAADQMDYFDESVLSATAQQLHTQVKEKFEEALNLNAKERSRRFSSIDTRQEITAIRKKIKQRSVSLFEPRPELGHGTNSICIVGRRSLSKNIFLDRRAFLNSYDYRTDPEGIILPNIMRPLGPVCGGINLEYYFSRVDNHKIGAGTKLPHNVVGLFGVANSSDGDLRPGLPLQMIEVHDPVRLLIIVEHYPDIVLKTIQSAPEIYEWYINEWIHLIALHPESGEFHYFDKGYFRTHTPGNSTIKPMKNLQEIINEATEMQTNHIRHATKENLPVFILNK